MTSIESVTLEVPDPAAANAFYTTAFGLDTQVGLRACEPQSTGFRGFTLSLVVSQPATVDALIGPALDAGATPLKPVAKSLWGYGGVVEAPDGAIWKVRPPRRKIPVRQLARSTRSCSFWELRMSPRASSSTSTAV
ncbi:MAG: hypothetical protein WB698_00675 [Solirubrobacteraceae bacterium]